MRASETSIPVTTWQRRLVPPSSPRPMLAHPDGSIWVLDPPRGVRRLRGEVEEWLCDPQGLAMPEASRVLRYSHAVQFYFDTARGAPVWLVSTYAADPASVLLAVWTGSRFAAIEAEGAVPVLGGDGFAFDAARGVLVHLLGCSDTGVREMEARAGSGGARVRELGADGVWREVGPMPAGTGRSRYFAGWDARRRKVVVIDEESRRTFAWDGRAWEVLADFPTMPWAPWAMAQGRGGRLVYVHRERSTEARVHAWALDEAGWVKQEARGWTGFGGAVYDAAADACRVASPWLGSGTIPTQWGIVADGLLQPAGALVVPACGATRAGPPVAWGAGPDGLSSGASVCVALTEAGPRPLPAPPEPALALVGAAGALWSVGPRGEVGRLDLSGGTWERRAKGALVQRLRADVGADPASGRILLVGGEPPRGRAYMKDVWLFAEGAWQAVEAKGARPAVVGAHVAFHAGLAAWMVVGGFDNRYRREGRMWLCDGETWTNFAASWEGDEPTLQGLAWDPTSAQMLAVADDRLWVYAGEGAWRSLGRFAEAPGVVAYDERARRVVSTRLDHDWGAEVGALLDAARTATEDDMSTNARTKKTAAKKTAAKKTAKAEAPALPAKVWLRLQDGESDKFWFASVEGDVWASLWGRRGRTAQETRTRCGTPAAARTAYEKAVRAKLAAGYEHAPEKEAAAKIAGRTAWVMKIGAKGEDLFGGTPPGVDAKRWPCCADCEHPMQFVALLHADPERLPLKKAAAVALFACNGEFSGGTCETWEADAGCNQALLLTAAQLAKPALAAPPTGPKGEAPIKPMRARRIAYKPRFEADPEVEENVEDPPIGSKVGGFPGWIQGDDTPECERCGGPMQFVAQIEEHADRALNFGGGAGYLFACPHAAKFLWQQ